MSTELAVVYAALILMDDNIEITAEKLEKLVSAAGVEVEPIWFSLYAKALAGQDLKDLVFKAVTLGAISTADNNTNGTDPATDGASDPDKEDEDVEISDDELVIDIFGDF